MPRPLAELFPFANAFASLGSFAVPAASAGILPGTGGYFIFNIRFWQDENDLFRSAALGDDVFALYVVTVSGRSGRFLNDALSQERQAERKPCVMFTILSAHDYFEPQYVLRKSLPTSPQHVAEWERSFGGRIFFRLWRERRGYGDHPRQTMEIFKAASGRPARRWRSSSMAAFGGRWSASSRASWRRRSSRPVSIASSPNTG